MLLEQKTAVIYGAAGAIGGAVARAFSREGARVFLAGHTRAPLEALAQELSQAGDVAEAAQVDALDALSIEGHLHTVVEKTGGIDIAFNAISIGYTQGTPLVDLPLETFSLGIADAMKTQFLTSTAAARHMQKRGSGVIMTLTATPARMLLPNQGNFGIACAAIERLCKQLACELGPQGIRVICLRSAGSPDAAGVAWAIRVLAKQAGVSPEAFEVSVAEKTLLKRLPKLAEVAEMAVLMASDRASAMTGAVANVTCGETVD
ncbi:MAG TPA: SDR family oxidoreductase [Ktedonobacterales bacterium]|nr:SDR family oxidoreductase [Ktedonobacterales bacterium]